MVRHFLDCGVRLTALAVAVFLMAGVAWGQRELKNIPDPDPELERKTFQLAEGLEVNLWAGDPLLAKPIQMNFDARGRLWIASSEVYPHIKPGQPATDKILVLEDKNGDGKAETTTVFADGLLIPTGVAPGDGGAYVANSTELIHLKDTDGDGKADESRIVLSGFGTEDTHHLLHTLRWGHDGCLYMNQSIYIHSHVETPYGVKRLNGGGIWRFRPENLQLDILCYGFVNPWGHHFDRWGQNFATDGAYGEGINYVFPGSVFVTAPGAKRIVAGLNPGSPKHCGLEIASGGHLPDDWQGNMLTNDFRAHRVCRFVVTEDASGYASRQETEIIKSNHVAFRPIDVKMGPDGAIYIADWYNPIIQHGEVDFRDPRRDHVHGRIWRVTYKGRPTLKLPDVVNAPTPALLEHLKANEEWVRLHAKLTLKSRGSTDVVPQLTEWLSRLDAKDPNYSHHRLEALWTYQSLDTVNEDLLRELLRSPDHRVRAAAVRVASLWMPRLSTPVEYLRLAVDDEHPRVRLEAVRALATVPSTDAAKLAAQVLDKPLDRFLDFAVWQAMRDLERVWLPAVQAGSFDFGGRVDHLTYALQAAEAPGVVGPLLNLIRQNKVAPDRIDGVLALVASLGGPKDLGAVLNMVLDPNAPLPPAGKALLLTELAETTQQRRVRPEGDLNRVAGLLQGTDDALRAAAARAAGAWKLTSARDTLASWARAKADDPKVTPELRAAAFDGLAALGGAESIAVLDSLASEGGNFDQRYAAALALVTLDVNRAAQRTGELLRDCPPGINPAGLVAAVVGHRGGPDALADVFSRTQLKPDVAKLVVRAVQTSSTPSPALVAAAQMAGGLQTAGWKLTPELLSQLVAEVAEKGNPHRGEAVFRRKEFQCLKCHGVAGAGGRVGPDLVSIGASAQVDYLIESLLVPNAKVKEGFHSQLIETDEGRVVTGIVVRETKTELVLRDAEDRQVTIPTGSIELRREGRSLMPDGIADTLTREELVDLVRFMSELGKVGEFAAGPSRVVRRWQSLAWTQDAHRALNRSSYDTAASDNAALVWEPAYSRVAGDLPVAELPKYTIHPNTPPTGFVRCFLDVTTAGKVVLNLGDTKGLLIWIDGKPTPPAASLTFEAAVGTHQVTIAVDQQSRQAPVRVELSDATTARGEWK